MKSVNISGKTRHFFDEKVVGSYTCYLQKADMRPLYSLRGDFREQKLPPGKTIPRGWKTVLLKRQNGL